ncbi:hypothetical protein VN12_15845 [Pirellula sp. SH-Sr6A]|uniref:hypothetical protein n=1 Tax=Pirellula sp. SH-Sr6A TaxID=1632865 RepID=UPI00078C4F1C|nr:hypothetical protein [Pirellula sp. SH-Sr6A]AMV33600.1 hypothetical protein VN12_15845 [Pirellula sp. SH-Sr6A]
MDVSKLTPHDEDGDWILPASLLSSNPSSELIHKLAVPILVVFLVSGLVPLLAFSVSRSYSEQNSNQPNSQTAIPFPAEQ